jgi:ribonucleotide reductase beta subunit family protein with ferritin-like domain
MELVDSNIDINNKDSITDTALVVDIIEPILDVNNFRFTAKPINSKYQIFWDLYKKQKELDWTAEEIDYSGDYDDFMMLSSDEQHFIKMILAFFASSDGIVNFNLRERFLTEIQITEAQYAYGVQLMMENVHCVSSDTKILTDKGYITIGENENKKIKVWNGKQFSKTTIKYTGNSKLYQVELTNGMTLKCTPQHKWYIQTDNHLCEKNIIFTENLNVNDVIYKYNLPLIDVKEDNFKNPYIHGFFCRNNIYCNNYQKISLGGEKMKLLGDFSAKTYDDILFFITGTINKQKTEVPTNYSKNTKLRWLEGLCDSNGCVIYKKKNGKILSTSIQISNTDLQFLKDVQLMLTTLGIHAQLNHENSKECHVINITDCDVIGLTNIGFSPKRLKIISTIIPTDEKSLIKIKSITILEGIHETYCFTEPLEHSGIFNGILTGQSEVYSDMLINIVKEPTERNMLFNAMVTIPSVKNMSDWALKWINSKDSIAHRVMAFAIVEGVFFSGAFAAIFWLKKQRSGGKLFMEGLINSNTLISRDEGIHCNFAAALYSFILQRVSKEETVEIFKEANFISKEFITSSIKCQLIGMSEESMNDYINYVSDRLLVMLGYDKLYNATNPFEWMDSIGLQKKGNFFETRPGEYQKAHNQENKDDKEFKILEDF